MTRMTIEIGRNRIVLYKEGGYHLEEYVAGIGWVMNDWGTRVMSFLKCLKR